MSTNSISARRLYHDDMYRFDQRQPSYWEATAGDDSSHGQQLEGDTRCDVAIIGGGYTGLSAALHFARDFDGDVRVLEAGHIGWGASGRNGGFCSIGGCKLDGEEIIARYGIKPARSYFQSQVNAIELVRSLIMDEGIDSPIQGDSELEVAWSKKSFEQLKEYSELMFRALGMDTFVLSADEFREQHFDCTEQFGASVTRPTFGLHPMKFVRGLARAAEKHGAGLHPHSEVIEWSKSSGEHVLTTAGGTLKAKRVIVACNGFMPEHLQPSLAGRPLPMISAIVVTRPLTADELAAHHWQTESPSITARNLLNYFRVLPDNRFMFGGRGHSTGDNAGTARTYRDLQQRLGTLWPAWSEVEIDYQWHGLICMTRRLTPALGRLPDDPSVYFGFGYHGNGVNTAVWAGKQIADWIGNGKSRDSGYPEAIPEVVRGLTQRFPMPSLRLLYLQARLALYRLEERT